MYPWYSSSCTWFLYPAADNRLSLWQNNQCHVNLWQMKNNQKFVSFLGYSILQLYRERERERAITSIPDFVTNCYRDSHHENSVTVQNQWIQIQSRFYRFYWIIGVEMLLNIPSNITPGPFCSRGWMGYM